MIRNLQIVISFGTALVFAGLAVRAFSQWAQLRERRSAHLALATTLFATSQFISANNSAFYNALAGNPPPRWISATSGTIGVFAFYWFILFLFDFVHVPAIARAVALLGTLEFMILAVVEHGSLRSVDGKLVGVFEPLDFHLYLWLIVGWYLAITGALWVSFLLFGLRNQGLARTRMLLIAGGFFLFFVVIGLIPMLLINNNTAFWKNFATVLGALLLMAAPLLLIGFAPPRWLKARFPEPARGRIRRAGAA